MTSRVCAVTEVLVRLEARPFYQMYSSGAPGLEPPTPTTLDWYAEAM